MCVWWDFFLAHNRERPWKLILACSQYNAFNWNSIWKGFWIHLFSLLLLLILHLVEFTITREKKCAFCWFWESGNQNYGFNLKPFREKKKKLKKIIKSQKHEFSKRINISSQCHIPCMTSTRINLCCFDWLFDNEKKMLPCRDECQSNLSKWNCLRCSLNWFRL